MSGVKKIDKELIDNLLNNDVNLKTRTIYLSNEIDSRSYELVEKVFDYFESVNNGPITIKINSEGGYVTEGMAIYDRIKISPCHVTIIASGSCMSMATIILQAADTRLIRPNCCYMIHYGSIFIGGEAKSVGNWHKFQENVDHPRTEQIYLEKMKEKNKKITLKKLQEMLGHDTILTAEEAVDLGLADRIM